MQSPLKGVTKNVEQLVKSETAELEESLKHSPALGLFKKTVATICVLK